MCTKYLSLFYQLYQKLLSYWDQNNKSSLFLPWVKVLAYFVKSISITVNSEKVQNCWLTRIHFLIYKHVCVFRSRVKHASLKEMVKYHSIFFISDIVMLLKHKMIL